MSGRRLLNPLSAPSSAWRIYRSQHAIQRPLHYTHTRAGGLLRNPQSSKNFRKRPWPFGAYSLHDVPAVRNISFARALPNLAVKFLRIPAMFGGAAIAGLAYIQYQATRMLLQIRALYDY